MTTLYAIADEYAQIAAMLDSEDWNPEDDGETQAMLDVFTELGGAFVSKADAVGAIMREFES